MFSLIFCKYRVKNSGKLKVAFTIALILYAVLQVVFMIIDPANIYKGVILKIFIIVALVKAIKDAKKYEAVIASIGPNQ